MLFGAKIDAGFMVGLGLFCCFTQLYMGGHNKILQDHAKGLEFDSNLEKGGSVKGGLNSIVNPSNKKNAAEISDLEELVGESVGNGDGNFKAGKHGGPRE